MYAIMSSALLYLGAFIYPKYLYAGVFVWMLPLLQTDRNNAYGFKAGYAWGLLFFAGHFAWLACTVYTQGKGDYRMFAYFACVTYFSLFSGFWLWFKQVLVYRYVHKITNQNRKCAALGCTWIISTVTFIYLTCYCSFAIFDCFDGYTFINPLLPLVYWHAYLQPIFIFHSIFGWVFIIICNFVMATANKKCIQFALIFFISIILIERAYWNNCKKIFVKENNFFYLCPTWNNQKLSQSQIFYEIGRRLDRQAQSHPATKFVIMPESAFPYDLMSWKYKLDAWTSLFDDVTIFIGGHRYEQGKIFNSLYQIQNGIIVAWYDKTHLVPFVERMPKWLPVYHTLFVVNDCLFSYPTHDQSNITLGGFIPCICSELFCNKKRPIYHDKPFLFICNDSWLALDYAKDLAKRSAKLYSLQYQLQIIYVGTTDWCIM